MDKHKLLHPPLPVKKLENNDEALFIIGTKNGKFEVVFLDAHFNYLPKSMAVPVKEFSKFLDLPACQNIKAVIFLLADRDNESHLVNLGIRQMVYEEVRKRKWHLYLVHPKTIPIMSMVFASKIDSKPGDVILYVYSKDQQIAVSEIQRKQEGYSYLGDRIIYRLNRSINDVAAECLGTCNPKYVTVCDPQNNDLVISLKSRFFPSKKVIKVDLQIIFECTPQILKTIFHQEYNHLIISAIDELAVTNESYITALEQAVIVVEGYAEDLPCEKVQIVPKSKKPYYVAYLDTISGTYKPAGETQTSKEQQGHRIKLALVVDRNSLPFLYQEPFIIPEVQELPKKLSSSKADLNVLFIGFYDNSSFICVRDENGYKFLNEWNGLYGNDLYLCFEQEELTVITDLNKVNDKDPFVVYDLIKVLSMPADDLKVDPKWGFKVTSSSDNPVLLEVETFSGIRKATPVFMMALLLKHHIKTIKKETGKKPKEVGFFLFNQFTNEEKNLIQNGLEEACKLLKIDFVAVSNV